MTIHRSEAYIECDSCKRKLATIRGSWFRREKKINNLTNYVEFTGHSIVPDGYHMPVYVKFPMHLCYKCYGHLLNSIKDIKDNSNEKDSVDNSKSN